MWQPGCAAVRTAAVSLQQSSLKSLSYILSVFSGGTAII